MKTIYKYSFLLLIMFSINAQSQNALETDAEKEAEVLGVALHRWEQATSPTKTDIQYSLNTDNQTRAR